MRRTAKTAVERQLPGKETRQAAQSPSVAFHLHSARIKEPSLSPLLRSPYSIDELETGVAKHRRMLPSGLRMGG